MTRDPHVAELLRMAAALGVRITYTDLSHLERDGDYNHETGTIRLQQGMSRRLHRSVLAHEIAHAVFGDTRTMFGPVNAKQERRADEWAARHLITLDAYRDAEQHRGGHIPSMAHDLDVITDLVDAYQRTLLRLDNTVYLKAREGAGQWDEKVTLAEAS